MTDPLPFPRREGQVSGGGDGPYDKLDDRLRAVEIEVGGIKVTLRDVATKKDVTIASDKLKIWALIGALIGAFSAVGWFIRILSAG